MKHMDGQLKEHATVTCELLLVILQNLLERGMVLKDEGANKQKEGSRSIHQDAWHQDSEKTMEELNT